jgi:hypothetical protein
MTASSKPECHKEKRKDKKRKKEKKCVRPVSFILNSKLHS